MLYYGILYYVMLCYVMLYYIILFYTTTQKAGPSGGSGRGRGDAPGRLEMHSLNIT